MLYHILKPTTAICSSIELPASKSISNRALIINALSYSPFSIENLAKCDDTDVMQKALNANTCHFDIQAAGTAMRFLTAFLSKIVGEWTITGTERMKNRPIKVLVDALNHVGARIEYIEKEGYPPLRILGSALQGGEISLQGDISSQYISALLMIAPLMEQGLTLHLEGSIISRPYINLTLQLMQQFGVKSQWEGATIRVKPQEYQPIPFSVESDWSAASYWYEMALLSEGTELELLGLSEKSLQGDAMGAHLFAQLGVETTFHPHGVTIKVNQENIPQKWTYDFVNEPDLAQTFVVACALKNIPFTFTGLQSLKIKETDRIKALKAELKKLGYLLTERDNSILEWKGERCDPEKNPVIETYEDHRMAMAFAPVSLLRPEGICIASPEVVSKSYPLFWEHLKSCGFLIKESSN